MDFSIKFVNYSYVRMVHCIYQGMTGYSFQKNIVFLSLKVDFALTYSAAADELPHSVAEIFQQ